MKVQVMKYDPSVDTEPALKDYEVPKTEYMTVLEAIMYIDENLEPLAYDYSCRGRVCGRCAIMLNGVPCTACTTAINDRDNIIEPLKGHPVVRDLVVDKHAMQDRIAEIELRVRAKEISIAEVNAPVDYKNVFLKVDPLEWCSRCLVCNAICPARNDPGAPDEYIGPAGMMAIALRHYDPYDDGDRVLQAVQEGMWNCIMCGKCDEVCPAREIKHVQTWTELRALATARELTERKSPVLPYA